MAGTINPWNNQIASANSAITLNSGTNAINIGTDATSSTINVGTGGTAKNINIGSYNNTGDMIISADSGNIIISKDESSTGSIGIGGGIGTYGISIGLTGAKTIGVGSYNESFMELEAYSIDMAAPIINISDNTNPATVNIGTGADVKTVTVGSTNSTSSLTLNSGSGGIKAVGVASVSVANKNYVTINTSTGALGSDSGPSSSISITGDTGGALSGSSFTFSGGTTGLSFGGSGSTETLTFAGITANGGTVSLATDATTSTVDVGTGAGAKTVTLGSTNSSSSLALKYGTSDFTLSSATGTVMSALDTGEITYPLQPAFFAILPSQVSNVTGNGTVYTLGTGTALTEIYDRNSDFNTNGTFTAPVTGIYTLYCSITFVSPSGGGTEYTVSLVTSNRTYILLQSPTRSRVTNFFGPNGYLSYCGSVIADMDAGDTATITVMAANGTLTSSVLGAASPYTWFGGNLTC